MARKWILFLLVFLAAIPQIQAQEVSLSPPNTIWASELDGGAVHVQSGLPCPLKIGEFRRANLQLYDKGGFDVGCDYRIGGSEITLYLTRINPADFARHFADAKGAIEKRIATAKPRDATLPLPPGFSWSRASYLIPERDVITEVLMAPFHGWYLEYRITYAFQSESAVAAALGDLSGGALKEAGSRFSACEAVPAVERKGKPLSDPKEIMSLTIVTGGLMGKSRVVDVAGGTTKEVNGVASPVLSCAADAFSIGNDNYVYWHDVGPQNEPLDRITSVNGVDFAFMQNVLPLSVILSKPAGGSGDLAKYAVIVDRKESWDIMAFFDGLPDMEAFARAALLSKTGVLARVSKTGNKIELAVPPQAKSGEAPSP